MTNFPERFFETISLDVRLHDLKITPEIICSRVPAGTGSTVFCELVRSIFSAAPRYLKIRGGWRIFEPATAAFSNRSAHLNGTSFEVGNIIFPRLKNCDSVALLAVSIGSGMEEWSKSLIAANDYLEGYAVDIVASEIVESAADFVQNELARYVSAAGWNVTTRYSPGYCGWNVVEQKKLFALLPPNFCGISLNNSAMMSPVKSISALIGTGNGAVREEYDCHKCDMHDCLHRRKE